ncbi:MAG: hypothetical protein HRT92_07950 [Piscirickettsiaceae bacterium]|nr:hypothetical protein [Piscirickettsiaceae bacterium]
MLGEVTKDDSRFLGIYSQTAIGVKLKSVNTQDGAMRWQSHHIAKSHAGRVPLIPIDIAVGLYSVTENVSDKLFRRLLSTCTLGSG